MADDVEIIIGADSSKLQREVRDATAELDRLRTASDRLGRSSAEMDAAIGKAAKRLDDARGAAHRAGVEFDNAGDRASGMSGNMQKLQKVMQLSGDALGPYAGLIGDIGDAYELMGTTSATLAVGVGILADAFWSALQSSLDVIRNADDYNLAVGSQRDTIYEAKQALSDLDAAFARQKVAMAEEMAPAITKFSYAYIGMADNISRAVTWLLSGFSESAVGQWLANNSAILAFIDGQAARGKKIADEARVASQEAEAAAAAAKAEQDALKSRQQDEAAAARSRAGHISAETTYRKKLTGVVREQRQAVEELVTTYEDEMVITASPPSIEFEMPDIEEIEILSTGIEEFKQANYEAAGASTNVWKESASDIAGYAVNFATSITGMVTELAQRNTAESRKERLKQFRTMKAAAIVEATINTALAATSAFAQGGGVPVGLVLAGLTIAAGAVQIGMIASQQPTFHRGGIMRSQNMGLAGDERSFSATTRANEAVVLTQQAMGAFAGQLSRANAGEGMGGGMAPVYVMVDGRAAPTRQFARPDPLYGRRRLA